MVCYWRQVVQMTSARKALVLGIASALAAMGLLGAAYLDDTDVVRIRLARLEKLGGSYCEYKSQNQRQK